MYMLTYINSTYRFLQAMSLGYVSVFWTAFYAANPSLATAYYMATATTFGLTLGARIIFHRVTKDFALKIEFDVS